MRPPLLSRQRCKRALTGRSGATAMLISALCGNATARFNLMGRACVIVTIKSLE